jgi:hypothetical protein
MSEQLNFNIVVGGNAYESLAEIRKEISKANNELAAAQQNFGKYSNEAKEAANKIASLKKAIQDTTEAQKLFNPQNKLQVLSQTLSTVAGGFAAVQGAIGLVGGESKELEKQLLKVQSALALSQGISTIADSFKDFQKLGAFIQSTTIFQKANAAANVLAATTLRAFGVAAETTAVGFKVLKGAIVSTGIGALILLVGVVINKMMEWTDSSKDVEKANKDLNDEIERQNRLIQENLQGIDYVTKMQIANAKKRGASAKELRDIEINGDKDRLQALKKASTDADAILTKTLKNTKSSEEAKKEAKKNATDAIKNYNDELLKQELDNAEYAANQAEDKRKKDTDAANKASEKAKAKRQKDKEEREQEERDEAERQQAKADRESAAQKIIIAAYRSTLDKRNQDLLAAEDDFENKKGDLIRAGIYDFTLLEEEYRLKVLEINKTYNDKEEEEFKKNEEKRRSIEETNKQRELETKELRAVTLQEKVQLELEALENEYNAKLLLAIANGENILTLEQNYAAKKLAITKKSADEEKEVDKALKEAKEQALLAGLNFLGAVAGENEKISNIIFGIQKALEIGKIITSTAGAITAVGTQTALIPPLVPPGIPNPMAIKAAVLGAKKVATLKLNAASQIATIAGATISKFKGSSGGGIGGSASAATTATTAPLEPPRPQPQTTNISQESINALGNQAIRAYVVETDVTSNQKRVQAIKQRARFS